MDPAEALALPSAPAAPRRPPLPMLAAVVPVVSGIVLWSVTGSLISLCFAALGPLMLLASFADGARTRRKETRRLRAEEESAWERVGDEYAERAERERRARRRARPDAADCLLAPPLRAAAVEQDALLVVGRGCIANPIRFTGGDGSRARAFREERRELEDVPLTAPLGGGVAVRGHGPVADAVLRALVLQVCLRYASRAIRLDGAGAADLGLEVLPQMRTRSHEAWPVRVLTEADGVVVGHGTTLVRLDPGEEAPPGIATVLDVVDPLRATLRTPAEERACAVEAVSRLQGEEIARMLEAQADADPEPPAALSLAEAAAPDAGGELRIGLGRDAREIALVDLVDDGPHALVTGMTGAGKSELLVSWVTAMATALPPERVCFVLADFKGGTAFDALRELPHVAAVITDLDGGGAERGVQSLRAELRRREGVLAEHGARSIAEAAHALPRLVIVVDEFAALLQEHPDLAAVFTDIAARGRALGMHLILGTQRATGVVRDALAANCPLRLSLRVTDPADSRAIIGTDEAALLPGDAAGRGLALVRRAGDAAPKLIRVARTRASDIRAAALRHAHTARAVSPWQPPLPRTLALADARQSSGVMAPVAIEPGALLLGLVDEPALQRQTARVLVPGRDRGLVVFGGPGAGKSTALAALRAQEPDALVIPHDPEIAWSLVVALADGTHPMPRLVLCDDVDALLSTFPLEHAQAWADALRTVLRTAHARGSLVVLSAGRASAQVSAIADLVPARAVLRMANRAEHLAAGGEASGYDPERPPGRAVIGGLDMQIVDAGSHLPSDESAAVEWTPTGAPVAVIAPMSSRVVRALREAHPGLDVQEVAEAATADRGGSTGFGTPAPLVGEASTHSGPVVVGDADAWQRAWTLWQRMRQEHEVLVLAESARELRTLAGIREIPPYARTDAGRAWRIVDGRIVERVIIPALARA